MNFLGTHILSINQFDTHDVERIFSIAEQMQPYAHRELKTRVLEGAILGSLFFEPSTRTRISFGCAFNLLGGEVRETTEIRFTALAKGESLYDTARVISGYSDIIAMRHPMDGSVEEFSKASRVPVINAGDGSAEHPSQALLDLYTIKKELNIVGEINGLNIALVGDLKYGRTVHSLCKLLKLYQNISFTFISSSELKMPQDIVDELLKAGHEVNETEDMEMGLHDKHLVYLTRVQEERFNSQEEANNYRGKFRLNQSIYKAHCEPNTVIMHPLPRDSRAEANELDNDLNQHPSLAIFRQADNGVLIRMALFVLTLGVDKDIHLTSSKVNWGTDRKF